MIHLVLTAIKDIFKLIVSYFQQLLGKKLAKNSTDPPIDHFLHFPLILILLRFLLRHLNGFNVYENRVTDQVYDSGNKNIREKGRKLIVGRQYLGRANTNFLLFKRKRN